MIRISNILTSLVFPHYCPGCGNEWRDGVGWICPECWSRLPEAGPGLWSLKPELKNSLFVAFHYNDDTQRLVHQMKFAGREDIAPKLGQEAARRFRQWITPVLYEAIVPVPLHPTRRRERGYDQNLAIAKGVSAELNIPLRNDLIIRVRNTPPQSRLSDSERLQNLRGAFVPMPTLRNAPVAVLLIDDVIHTGQTILGCRDALKAAGVERIGALAACG